MARHATVDDYIAALAPPLRDIAVAARAAIDSGLADAHCAIRWAHPTWTIGNAPICYLKAASQHLTFGFWRGAGIHDNTGRLQASGHVMAHQKLRSLSDVDVAAYAGWLAQARDLAEQVTSYSGAGMARAHSASCGRSGC